jgi:hypothetical protein
MLIMLLTIMPIAHAVTLPPTPFPIFLKSGYSTILEFDEAPSRVVLGDTQNFQVERLEKSLVVKTVNSYAASNMFVYFKNQDTRLFVLTASEDAEPTYYKKFEAMKIQIRQETAQPVSSRTVYAQSGPSKIHLCQFDTKKDYLTVEALIKADSKSVLKPNWSLVRLTYNGRATAPFKLWAERKDVQRDATIKTRFIFAKPNLSRDLKGVTLVIPLLGETRSIILPLKGVKQ